MTTPYNALAAILKFTHTYDRWTREEFAIGTGMSKASTERIVSALRERKVIHIDAWLDDSRGRQSIAMFTVGPGQDARKRTAKTGSQRQKAYKLRQRTMAERALQDALAAMVRLPASTS